MLFFSTVSKTAFLKATENTLGKDAPGGGGLGARVEGGIGLPGRGQPAQRERPRQVALLPARAGFVLPVDEHDREILVVFDDVFHRVKLRTHRQESEWGFPCLWCLQVKVRTLSFPGKRDGLVNLAGEGGGCRKSVSESHLKHWTRTPLLWRVSDGNATMRRIKALGGRGGGQRGAKAFPGSDPRESDHLVGPPCVHRFLL